MVKRRLPVIAGILLLVTVATASWAAVRRVRAEPPDSAIEVSGRIEGEDVIVNSKIGGRVQELLVREGAQVTRGQLVAVLNSDELDARARGAVAQIEAAQAQVTRAEGEVRVLKSQLAQARAAVALAEAQAAAQQQQARAGLDASVARLGQSRKVLAAARVQAPTAVDAARAAVRAAEADLTRAHALHEEARRDLARLQSLQAAGAVAIAQVDAARAQLDVATAQVEMAAAQVQRARAALVRAETGLVDVQVREDEIRVATAQVDAARGQVAAAAAASLEVQRQREQLRAVAQQVDIARAAASAARAQLASAVAARDELQSVVRETRVITPIAGVVTSRVANAGEVVAAGTPLVIVVDLRALWLKVFVPGPEIGKLRLGAPARIAIDAFPNRVFTARITEISQRAEFTPKDIQTREERVKQVFAVKLAVENPDGTLKPGMPADALLLWKDAVPR